MRVTDYGSGERHLNAEALLQENAAYQGTGGISQNNRPEGFLPAFLDTLSGKTYLSRFSDGRPAPIHLLEGLPEEVIMDADAPGTGRCIKSTVISGFMLGRHFYTRAEAALHISCQS